MFYPSVNKTVVGPTTPYYLGSVATTLNSTALNPPLTRKVSPFFNGLYASLKYGTRYVFVISPVIP